MYRFILNISPAAVVFALPALYFRTPAMLYKSVVIEALSAHLPAEMISSEEIETRLAPLYQRLHLPEGRLALMTGITQRRLWPPATRPSEPAADIARQALDAAQVSPQEVDCLLYCAVSRDNVEPATATAVHHRLGLPESTLNFDVSNACLGILSGIATVANMIELGQIRRGLVVAAENSRPLMEHTIHCLNNDTTLTRKTLKPWFASLTIGSAATAVLLADQRQSASSHHLRGAMHRCDTRFNQLCQGDGDSGMTSGVLPVMQTDAEELLARGINVARETWGRFMQELQWNADSLDLICTHQVGKAHRQQLYEALGLDLAKDFSTFEFLGNCGSASLTATAAIAEQQQRLQPGTRLALLGIGSGINCMMMGVDW
jgi:3-oxoacyl-[acyl-carrier-protein] synthase III